MSQEDPKNTGTPEEASENTTSRRRFLKGGAAAAVGAIAAGAVSPIASAADTPGIRDAEGNPLAPVTYHPNENLVLAIVRAWTEPEFAQRLKNYDGKAQPIYSKAQAALAEVDVRLERPVVLTPEQYRAGYRKWDNSEVVFVLPNSTGVVSKYSLSTARVKMSETLQGM